MGAGLTILVVGLLGAGLICDLLAFLVKHNASNNADDPEELFDTVRVSRVVIVVLVVLLWGWSPSLGLDDPGEGSTEIRDRGASGREAAWRDRTGAPPAQIGECRLRTRIGMTLRRRDGLGECDARTQGAPR